MLLLARDHSSHTGAAVNGWRYPATSDALALMDLFDVYMRRNFRNPRPYPRPWDKPNRLGGTTLSPNEAVALLNRAKTGTL